MKKLSIAIPTYNRLEHLKKQVDFLEKEINFKSNEIELLISNNGSTDGTDEYLEELKVRNSNITIINNRYNMGIIANFKLLVEKAQGEYFWLLGDDDRLRSGIIQEIRNAIYNDGVSHVFLNYYIKRDEKLNEKFILFEKAGLIENGLELFEEVVEKLDFGAHMFITANILKRKDMLKAIEILQDCGERENMALPLAWALYSSTGKGFIIEKPYIECDCDNISWNSSRVRVVARDMIAACDVIARVLNLKTEIDRLLLSKPPVSYPAIRYAIFCRKSKYDNYALKWYWSGHKIKLFKQIIIFPFYCLKRGIMRSVTKEK